MSGLNTLLEHEDNWVTRMGAWFPGERVVLRGKDLLNELDGMPWMGVVLYGITGRLPDARQIRLFEAIWSLTASFPEPRLWNNRVAALAGTARSTGALGMAAAIALCDADVYGNRPVTRAVGLLLRLRRCCDEGVDLETMVEAELKQYRCLAGFGRPVARSDERIEPLMRVVRELGFDEGPHVRLAFEIERILMKRGRRMCLNAGGLSAALGADQGMSPRESYFITVLSFSGGMLPCYIDAAEKPEGAFFPLRCTRVAYEGKLRRRWSEAI
jgi:citrate synthase